jgi:hypothetical protein
MQVGTLALAIPERTGTAIAINIENIINFFIIKILHSS